MVSAVFHPGSGWLKNCNWKDWWNAKSIKYIGGKNGPKVLENVLDFMSGTEILLKS